jgi:hypothetical protein
MQKWALSLFLGALVLTELAMGATSARPNPLPQPIPQPPSQQPPSQQQPLPSPIPNSALKVFPRVNFIEGADLIYFQNHYGLIGGRKPESSKIVKSFDEYVANLRKQGRNRMGVTLESSLKANLDQHYRTYNPPQRNLQFVDFSDINSYDLVIYGTYSRAREGSGGGYIPYNQPRMNQPDMLITITIADLRSGESQSFQAVGEPLNVIQYLAGGLFHEYQSTRFPTDMIMFGKNLRLLEKNSIRRPTGSAMWELYKQAQLACEMQNARLTTEREITALGVLGDYRGGVSLGQNSVPTYYWAVDYNRVYVAPWSQSSPATNLNPQEVLNYVCVQDVAAPAPRPK